MHETATTEAHVACATNKGFACIYWMCTHTAEVASALHTRTCGPAQQLEKRLYGHKVSELDGVAEMLLKCPNFPPPSPTTLEESSILHGNVHL